VIAAPPLSVQADHARGRFDIPFFALRWLGIEGHPGQVAWWNACAERAADGVGPKYLTTVVSAGNRAGKTLAMAVLVAHHTYYKVGLRPPQDAVDAERWLRASYEWYHVGIQQEVAELVHVELVRIFAGNHPAQRGRGCPLVAELGPVVNCVLKDHGEYMMVSFHPEVGGGKIHFRSTQDKAKALLGKDMNGISFDEAGKEMYLMMLYQEVFNLRRLSTGGPLHFIGTPFTGMNEYYDLWELGNPENPNRDPQFASFRLSARQNIGFGLDKDTFDAIVRQTDPYLIPQNIDGEFIEAQEAYFYAPKVEECFTDDLLEEQQPIKAHRYSQGVDPGIEVDASWAITLDHTVKGNMVGVRIRKSAGKQSIPAVVNMVREGHHLYGPVLSQALCATTIDGTAMGGKMWVQEFKAVIPNIRVFDFGGTKSQKLKMLSDLKTVIDKGGLKLPRQGRFWQELRRQLLSYKLDDKKITQDAVMALGIAVYHAVRNSETPDPTLKYNYFG
jgi:Terminase-like family.